MYKTLEHNEHASHIAHEHPDDGGHHAPTAADEHTKGRLYSAQMAALLIAGLAAGLALSEQGAKHAEIRVQENLVDAVDAWAQYQAKSTRSTVSRDVMSLIGVMEPAASPELAERRKQALAQLAADQERFDNDPHDGRTAIAARARDFEKARDLALEQTHAYHNGSALMELGIVLSTASAILGSRKLLAFGGAIGVFGLACAAAGYFEPAWGAF